MSKSPEKTMIVNYGKANRLSLPYKNAQGQNAMHIFVPGKNEVDPVVFDAVKEMQGDKWDHYARHMKIDAVEETRRGSVMDLSAAKFEEVIENTYSVEELENYRTLEEKRPKGNPRKGVLKAIEAQIIKVQETDDELGLGDSEGSSEGDSEGSDG